MQCQLHTSETIEPIDKPNPTDFIPRIKSLGTCIDSMLMLKNVIDCVYSDLDDDIYDWVAREINGCGVTVPRDRLAYLFK